jgi:hypothetical protein
MATDNRGVMVYLTPELERELEQYCLDNDITRKHKDGAILPALGTGILQYLKSNILGTSPSNTLSQVPSKILNPVLTKAEVLDIIAESSTSTITGIGLTREDVFSIATEIKQALGSIESEVTNIKTMLANVPSPPLLALESPPSVESVTTDRDPTDWELSPIADLASKGMNSRQIADELNLLGFTNTRGGAVTRQSVENYLNRRPGMKAIYENARKKGTSPQ